MGKLYNLYFEIDQLPKSLNKKLRSHHLANHKENLSWKLIVKNALWKRLPSSPLQKAKISIVRHSHRSLDFDGLVGSLKPVVDALVACEVLSDDSWNVLGQWDCNQKFRPKSEGPKLEIIIQEMPINVDEN